MSNETRTLAVRIPPNYCKSLRKIAIDHDLKNAQVVTWALELLFAFEREGGQYEQREKSSNAADR